MIEFMDDEEDNEVTDAYADIMTRVAASTIKNPILVAAVMIAQGLSIYKTVLDDAEFEDMMEEIYNNRHNVKPFEQDILH